MPCGCSGRHAGRPTTLPRAASPAPPAATADGIAYTGAERISLRGPFSGRIYRVGPEARRVAADPRDVAALLRTGFFARVPA